MTKRSPVPANRMPGCGNNAIQNKPINTPTGESKRGFRGIKANKPINTPTGESKQGSRGIKANKTYEYPSWRIEAGGPGNQSKQNQYEYPNWRIETGIPGIKALQNQYNTVPQLANRNGDFGESKQTKHMNTPAGESKRGFLGIQANETYE